MIGEPLWGVDGCSVDADHPRTADPRAWDVPETHLQRQIRALVARQREQQTPLVDRSSQRLQTVLAPTHTTPEEGS